MTLVDLSSSTIARTLAVRQVHVETSSDKSAHGGHIRSKRPITDCYNDVVSIGASMQAVQTVDRLMSTGALREREFL